MARTIHIDPVTRIEGHGKITLVLDDGGNVADARFHVTQFRGFEAIAVGRPFSEMPALMARTCGICPISHLIAGAKAGDEILAVTVPEAAKLIRRVVNLAQILQSHALSFFYLSSPDLLLGMDAPPPMRNLFGVAEAFPQFAKDGIALRKLGQEIIEKLAGKRIHPKTIVPGGVSIPVAKADQLEIAHRIPGAIVMVERAIAAFKQVLERFTDEIEHLANFDSLYLALVGPDGELEHYDGRLRLLDEHGERLVDNFEPQLYQEIIAERIEVDSFLKSPYYRPKGYPGGMYRVGPLARLNVIDRCGTPRADEELAGFRELAGKVATSSFHYHYARLIEMLFALESMAALLADERMLDKRVRSKAEVNRPEGIGVAEAPRGTLIHHYQVDDHGLVTKVNMIIATGHNNLAMNQGVLQVARRYVNGTALEEGMLNRVEAVIRTFDPCLSCSTHALGQMPLIVELRDLHGALVDQLVRG